MKKLLVELKIFGATLLVALTLQAQDQTTEPPPKPADDSSATNVLEKPEQAEDAAEPVVKKSRSSRHYRDRTVIGGSAFLAEGDGVQDMVVIGGSAEINGKVRGDLVVIGGSATMGTNAEVRGDLVVIGGGVDGATDIPVGGDRVVIGGNEAFLPGLRWLERPVEWIARVGMTGRPFPYQFAWSWIIAGLFIFLYVLASILFPRPLDKTVEVLELRPGASFLTGLLAFMLTAPLIIFLVFSFVGIVLVPVLAFGLLVAFFFGRIAVYRYAGQQLGAQLGAAFLQKPLAALLVGVLLFYALYMVPVLGFVLWAAIAPLALGAALLAFFKRFSTPKPLAPPTQAQGPLPGPPPPLVGQPASAMTSLAGPYSHRVGFWYRFAATIIDAAIIGTLLGMLEAKGPIFIVVWVAYHVAMWTWKGATIGAMALRIKLVRVDGQPVDFAVALVRAFSAFISAAALMVGFFWAGWTKERQSWHDRIAGTCVVKLSPALAPAF